MAQKKPGLFLRELRKEKELTQEQLAEKTNLCGPYIGMIERGMRVPSLDTFLLLLDALNASADEVLYGTIKGGYQTRIAKYEEKILQLNEKESKQLFAVLDAMLDES